MGIIKEFKEFAMKGNVVDLAVGVIMGTEFGKIVSSLVGDVIMPPIGRLVGGVDFSNSLRVSLGEMVVKEAGQDVKKEGFIYFGKFVQASFNFLIIAFAVFMLVKAMNTAKARMATQAAAAPPPPPEDVVLLREIRDALKKK